MHFQLHLHLHFQQFLLILLFGLVFGKDLVDIQVQFQRWSEKYGKSYSTPEMQQRAVANFENNLKLIEKWNLEAFLYNRSPTSGLTKFADMSIEDFQAKLLMPPRKASDQPCTISRRAPVYSVTDLPASFDWREHGAVTPVKDQGTVGTCWAFSTTGSIEGQWFLKTGNLTSLSEEQLNDCDAYDCGVFGGWPCRAFQYVIQNRGIMSESDYPYCVGTGDCFPCVPTGYNITFCGIFI